MTRTRKLIAAAAGGLALATVAAPAFADHYWRHRPYYRAPARVYYPPPRVVYVPPPAYYYTPPAYVYTPPPRASFGIWFRG